MNTTILIKTDQALKKAAQETAKELGVPLSTAVNVFLKQFVRDRELTISATYKPSPYLATVLAEAEEERRAAKKARTFSSVDALVADLDS